MDARRMRLSVSRAIAVLVVGFIASCALVPANAFAVGESDTYTTSNGWELVYSVSDDGTISIDDVTSAGLGTLVVPEQIQGQPVTAVSEKAFYNEGGQDCTASMTEIEIPETVTSFGKFAFTGCGLVKITIPASVQELPTGCFSGCKSLAEVTFAGESFGCIGESAFAGCSSLVRIDVPELTKTVGNETFRMGRKCFNGCSSLETVVFHGTVNTYDPSKTAHSGGVYSSTTSGYYVANIDCFNSCPSLKNVVYYCRKDSIPSGTGSFSFGRRGSNTSSSNQNQFGHVAAYMTLAFYGSAEDSAACQSPVYTITCKSTVKTLDIVNGTVDQDDIWEERGQRPALPEGMVWGIQYKDQDGSRVYANTTLDDSYNAIPVSENDLSFGWISCEDIDKFRDSLAELDSASSDYPAYYLGSDKRVFGLDKLVAYLPGGNLADANDYRICYQKESTEVVDRITKYSYADVDVPDSTGVYRLRAEGNKGSVLDGLFTSWFFVRINVFTPSVNAYADADVAARLGRASQAISVAVSDNGASGVNAACGVVVPAADWRYQLIGAGLAGVGNGVMLFDNGADYSSRSVTAFAQSKAAAIQIVGSSKVVPESANPSSETYLVDFLNERSIVYKTRYANDDTIQQLSDQIYTTIKRLHENGDDMYGEGWGTTALVVSPKCCTYTLPIAQLAYAKKAPVFFVQPDGLLSSADLGYIANDGFDEVVIVGDQSYISEECAQALEAACSFAPTRVLADGENSLEACMDFIDCNDHKTSCFVIAAANDPANVVAGSVLAACKEGMLFTCASTADAKRIQDYLRAIISENGQASVAAAYLIGDFSAIDSNLRGRIANMWSNPEDTSVGVGDTHEVGDYIYQVKSGNKAAFAGVRNTDLSDVVLSDFDFNGAHYSLDSVFAGALTGAPQVESITYSASGITSVGEGAFANARLKSVNLGSTVKSIGKNAFAGCTDLVTINAPKVVSVGAGAFSGCSVLAEANLPAATSIGASSFAACASLKALSADKVKKIGASAFKGCKALSSVSVAKAKTLGASAFEGCKALKSFKSTTTTSVGASAFKGCTRLTTVSLKATGLNKIGAKAFFGCKKLRQLTLGTKKLKAKNVGANAFKNLNSRVKVKVPKAKVKAYKKLFVKKGLAKKKSVVAG